MSEHSTSPERKRRVSASPSLALGASKPARPLLFLLGPRGCGKTTVARLLAEQLGWDWLDADTVLEARAGKTIRDLFATDGESAFRTLEAATLTELCGRRQCVIATGGGVVLREDNRARLRQAGACVWLTADAATLWRRVQSDTTTRERRPDLGVGGLAEIESVLHTREPLYRACADLVVDTVALPPDAVARAILSWWNSS